jgi:hypothetical protein
MSFLLFVRIPFLLPYMVSTQSLIPLKMTNYAVKKKAFLNVVFVFHMLQILVTIYRQSFLFETGPSYKFKNGFSLLI